MNDYFSADKIQAANAASPVVANGRTPFVVTGGLGHGGYAAVVRARHTGTGEEYALKVVSKKVGAKTKDRKRLALELKIMSELPANPYLVRCHAAFESASDIYFVLDLFTGGDLFFHLARVQEMAVNVCPFNNICFRKLLLLT